MWRGGRKSIAAGGAAGRQLAGLAGRPSRVDLSRATQRGDPMCHGAALLTGARIVDPATGVSPTPRGRNRRTLEFPFETVLLILWVALTVGVPLC